MQILKRLTKVTAAAAILGAASLVPSMPSYAVNLADDNQGEVAIFPYYTVRNGWQTFLRIINTSASTVAVKVRFRESYNSREVLDFQLVLSPYDMWNGWTDANAGGPGVPGLITDDNSCTAPGVAPGGFIDRPVALPDGRTYPTRYAPFKNISYQQDGGPTGLDRALEGYAEVISLGRIDDPNSSIAISALHDATGKPNCNVVENLLDPIRNSAGPDIAASQFLSPQNVIKANGYLFKGATGQGAGFDPVMLANFYDPDSDSENLIDDLDDPISDERASLGSQPDLNDAFPAVSKVRIDTPAGLAFFPASANATAFAAAFPNHFPVQVTDRWDRGIDAVSALIARTGVNNEWAARSTPGFAISKFQTEWVISFPTKHYYVDRDTADPYATLNDGDAIAPFIEVFQPNGQSCEPFEIDVYNREEGVRTSTSPFPIPGLRAFCREVNVLTFRADELGTNLTDNVADTVMVDDLPIPTLPDPIEPLTQYEGWAHVEFTGDNAFAGLGSDPEANQAYDAPPEIVVPAGAGPIRVIYSVGQQGVDDFSDAGLTNPAQNPDYAANTTLTAPDPVGVCLGGPFPQPTFVVNSDGTISGAGAYASPGVDPNTSGTDAVISVASPTGQPSLLAPAAAALPATLFELGVYSRPFLAGANPDTPTTSVPVAVTVDQALNCDDDPGPSTVGDLNFVGSISPEDYLTALAAAAAAVDNFDVTYTGLPTIGFTFSLQNSSGAEVNYAAVNAHGYEREVVTEALCNARFAHGTLMWVLDMDQAGNNAFNPDQCPDELIAP